MIKFLITATMLITTQVFAAGGHTGVMASNTYIREMPPMAKNSAAYMTLMNHTDKEVTLVKVTGDVAKKIEIHTHKKEGKTYKMMKLDSVKLEAHGYLAFKPKGHHIMLMGLKKSPKVGESYKLTLHFSNGKKLPMDFKVKKGDEASSDDHSHHHHH